MTNKTVANDLSVIDFLNAVEHETRRNDAFTLLDMMKDITGEEPVMWGGSIVGFGEYHYKYESGREGDMPMTGFSPRKANMSIYLMPGYEHHTEQLARLGKHKIGKSCLYITNLKNVDLDVLAEMIDQDYKIMLKKYHDDVK